jgi:site-specific recombinase
MDIFQLHTLWWATLSLVFIGVLNLGVSFYMAFRLALRAHNVSGVDRKHIRQAIRARLRLRLGSFFWPVTYAVNPPEKDTHVG